MRRMAWHDPGLAWAYAWDDICSTEESHEDLSLSLFVEYLDEKSPSSIQEGGIALEMVAMTIMGIFLKIETLDRNERWLNKFLM